MPQNQIAIQTWQGIKQKKKHVPQIESWRGKEKKEKNQWVWTHQ